MGDVIGLGRKRPNGAKIKELRNQQSMKQETLAEKANVAERVLRDIERRNHPVRTTTITAIATALQTTPDQITLSTPDGTPDSSVSLLKLTAIRSAKDLSALASGAADFEWKLEADPSPKTAKDMQQLMMMVRRLMHSWPRDEFDKEPFGEILRLAWLQQLLDQLREQGVGVIAGKYGRHSFQATAAQEHFVTTFTPIPGKPCWSINTYFVLCLHLVPAEKQEDDIQITGKSLDRLLEDARHLPKNFSEFLTVFAEGALHPDSLAWHALYQTKTGAFFKIKVNHDGVEILEFELISNIEARKLTEKYAPHLAEKYFEGRRSVITNPPTVNESLSRPKRRSKAVSDRLGADQER
jgi:transcriptional regulator with XRE-family HTH domain